MTRLKRKTPIGHKKQQLVVPDRNGSRLCVKCGEWKILESAKFKKSKSGVDGYNAHCTECPGNSKYGAERSYHNGRWYPSKEEAKHAATLELWLKAGIIISLEYQFKVEMQAYNRYGEAVLFMSHKVDFRVQYPDLLYKLVETKGKETDDYRKRREWLKKLWLPEHLDHTYVVAKDLNQLSRLVLPTAR